MEQKVTELKNAMRELAQAFRDVEQLRTEIGSDLINDLLSNEYPFKDEMEILNIKVDDWSYQSIVLMEAADLYGNANEFMPLFFRVKKHCVETYGFKSFYPTRVIVNDKYSITLMIYTSNQEAPEFQLTFDKNKDSTRLSTLIPNKILLF